MNISRYIQNVFTNDKNFVILEDTLYIQINKCYNFTFSITINWAGDEYSENMIWK